MICSIKSLGLGDDASHPLGETRFSMRDLAVLLVFLHAAVVIGISFFAPRRQNDEQFTIGARHAPTFGLTVSTFSALVTESLIFFAVALTARYGPWVCVGGGAGSCTAL